jgi:hypothetical protein
MKERIGTLFMKESCRYWRVKRKQKCCKWIMPFFSHSLLYWWLGVPTLNHDINCTISFHNLRRTTLTRNRIWSFGLTKGYEILFQNSQILIQVNILVKLNMKSKRVLLLKRHGNINHEKPSILATKLSIHSKFSNFLVLPGSCKQHVVSKYKILY